MTTPFMRAYSQLLIKTCHQRGIHAMGGMSAFIPVKGDEALNEKAFAQVRADKEREAATATTAHGWRIRAWWRWRPEVFDRDMPQPNQISRQRDDVNRDRGGCCWPRQRARSPSTGCARISVSACSTSQPGSRGLGGVPLYNLMEDAATAEISRAQVWQWIRHPRGVLDDGRKVTVALYRQMLDEEMGELRAGKGQMRFRAGASGGGARGLRSPLDQRRVCGFPDAASLRTFAASGCDQRI